MRELLRRLTAALELGREQVVCHVVDTRGSTPQKAGAMMVVDPDGGQLGTLGGGCVEAEVKQKAIRQIGQAGAELHSFVLDHDYAWADGLVCGGKMVIVTECLHGPEPLAYFRVYQELLESGQGFTEAVIVDPGRAGGATGAQLLFGPEGAVAACWPPDQDATFPQAHAPALADRPKPAVRNGVSYLPTLPRIRLVIVGAGHVGQAVAALASQADFDVWVVDDRNQYASTERFPAAQRIIVGPFEDVLPRLEVTVHTFALIVTRGHGHDQEALYHLAPTLAPYVGLIGSRRKIRLIFESLAESGIAAECLDRVSAPVGLDIGSQTVPEIAISIVAELIARRNLGVRSAMVATAAQGTAMIAAIVPAAGHGARMGRPKLILPIGAQTVIARVVRALHQGGAARIIVVAPPADAPGAAILAREAEAAGAVVVAPTERPIDMRASFERALDALAEDTDCTTLLLAPGDSVGITAELAAQVVARANALPSSCIVPIVDGRRGHPIALPRRLADEVRSLPLGVGINTLIKLHESLVVELAVTEAGAIADLDTPEDYERWAEFRQ